MTKQEFEALAKIEVSNEKYYKVIEPMYMATDLSKQEFIATLNLKAFALPSRRQMITEMKRLARHLYETCEHYTDYNAKDALDSLMKQYYKRFYGRDWATDTKCFCYTNEERLIGCYYPYEIVMGYDHETYEKININPRSK